MGVCEARLHYICKPYAIGAMPSLLQWHMVYELGEDFVTPFGEGGLKFHMVNHVNYAFKKSAAQMYSLCQKKHTFKFHFFL